MPHSRLAGQIAANTRWALEDPVAGTEAARRAALARFAKQVDPNNELPEAERERRAERLKRAHFQRMALRSAAVRRGESLPKDAA